MRRRTGRSKYVVTDPYPILVGILPALTEYHCHSSPVARDKRLYLPLSGHSGKHQEPAGLT